MTVKIEGVDALNKEIARIAREAPQAAAVGAFLGGLVVQAESQRNTPREFGNLHDSAYTQKRPGGAEVGYSAEYAIYVHENMEQKLAGQRRASGLGTYWNPGGPKVLERSVNEKASEVLEHVRAQIARVIK
jgi:hypothetical protein